MREDERLYWLGFSVFPGIGPVKFGRLFDYFGSAKAAWEASLDDLKRSKIGDLAAVKLDKFRREFSLEGYERLIRDRGCWYLVSEDEEYPRLLRKIGNAPFVLYGKGDMGVLGVDKCVGVVGTRRITQYGKQVTKLVVEELVRAGCVVVSGLAVGVDSVAHSTTLDEGGKTVAVLGSGVDVCSPAGNVGLYRRIVESGGAIVSEFLMGKEAMKGAFPSRNRIVAGLCVGLVVTEGDEDSGALITAKDAFEEGRKVFAIPGPITSVYSKGPNSLIGKGAVVVNSPGDILREFSFGVGVKRNAKQRIEVMGDEKVILDLLQEPKAVDVLIRETRMEAAKVGMILSLMEMKGLVRNMGAGVFATS